MTEDELRALLQGIKSAMRAEGCDDRQVRRVSSWLLYGQPDGPNARVTLDAPDTTLPPGCHTRLPS